MGGVGKGFGKEEGEWRCWWEGGLGASLLDDAVLILHASLVAGPVMASAFLSSPRPSTAGYSGLYSGLLSVNELRPQNGHGLLSGLLRK